MWVTIGSGDGEGLSVKAEGERFVVGSGQESQLMVNDPQVAPLHAYFQVREDGHVELHDLGSPTGTWVNGQRIQGGVMIQGGEVIRIGDTLLKPSVEDPAVEAHRLAEESGGDEPPPAVRVHTEGQTVEVVPDDPSTPDVDETTVRVRTEGEAVDVVPAGDRRRVTRLARRATLLAGIAAAIAAVAVVLALTVLGDDEGASTAEIVSSVKRSTVLVKVRAERGQGSGSGFVLDADNGLIVTNFHVVNEGATFAVGVEGDERPAQLISAAPCDDLAVLRTADGSGLRSAKLGSQDELEQGETVVAVGYPANASLEDNLSSTAGVVSVVESSFRFPTPDAPPFPNVIQTDAALNPSNSGGPLVDEDKSVVGVNTATVTGAGGAPIQGQGYAIGIDRAKDVLADLREGRSQGWGGFGILVPRGRELRRAGLPRGLLIASVASGSPAAQAGVVPGMLLVAIDGRKVGATVAGYCSAVGPVESGQTATLSVLVPPGRARQLRVRFP